MKAHLLLTTLGIMCSVGSIFSMDMVEKPVKKVAKVDQKALDKKPAERSKAPRAMHSYLGFKTDKHLYIREYESKNMEFAVPAKEFVGKKLTEAVPLSETDKKALEHGFKRARDKDEIRKVPYSIADAQFMAAIKYAKDKKQYSVRVTQADKTE